MLWDYSPQIRNVFFSIRKFKLNQKHQKKCLAAEYYLLSKIKNLLDVHHFFNESTPEMVTFMFLSVECTNNLQTIQKQ